MKRFGVLLAVFSFCLVSVTTCLADEGNPKSPGLAFALSFVLPAGGQYYDEDITKGLIFDAGIGLGVLLAFVGAGNSHTFVQQEGNGPFSPDPNVTTTTIGVITAASFWVVSWIDAPASADSYNRKHRQKQSTWNIDLSPLNSDSATEAMNVAFHF